MMEGSLPVYRSSRWKTIRPVISVKSRPQLTTSVDSLNSIPLLAAQWETHTITASIVFTISQLKISEHRKTSNSIKTTCTKSRSDNLTRTTKSSDTTLDKLWLPTLIVFQSISLLMRPFITSNFLFWLVESCLVSSQTCQKRINTLFSFQRMLKYFTTQAWATITFSSWNQLWTPSQSKTWNQTQ